MSRNRAGWRIVALLVLSSLVLAACGDDDDDTTASGGGGTEGPFHIGFVGALTGDNANLGINIRDGIRVALAEENA